jgi:hypothetical protein
MYPRLFDVVMAVLFAVKPCAPTSPVNVPLVALSVPAMVVLPVGIATENLLTVTASFPIKNVPLLSPERSHMFPLEALVPSLHVLTPTSLRYRPVFVSTSPVNVPLVALMLLAKVAAPENRAVGVRK